MNMKKKVFVIIALTLIAGTFSSCDFKISELKKLWHSEENNEDSGIKHVSVSESDMKYEWNVLEINGGGYVSGIVCSKAQKGLMYARTENSGAFRYDSESGKWISMTDFLKSDENGLMSVESIATDENEPNRVYMACGSLESGKNGVIFSSEDYGENWERFELPFPCGGDAAGRGSGERLSIDPNDSRTIYYGSRSAGLWKSSNYGKSWSIVPSFGTTGNFAQNSSDIGIMWIEFDKESGIKGSPTLNIYAGVADIDGYSLYVSENAGITWNAVDTELPGLYPVQAEFSENGNLYMIFNNNLPPDPDPGNGCIYSYNPQKNKFTDITPANSSMGSGFGGLAVSSGSNSVIAVSTLGYHYPKDNIYISWDSGETWCSFYDSSTDYYDFSFSSAQWLESDMKGMLGNWITSLCIDPYDKSHLIYGCEKGAFDIKNINVLSDTENPERKATVNDICDGLSILSVNDIVSADGKLYSISEKWGGFVQSDSVSEKFSVNGSVDIDCAWKNSDIAVRCGEHGSSSSTPVVFTDNGGKTWYSTAAVPENYDEFNRGSVCISAEGDSFIWIPESKAAYPVVTSDFGQTWTRCSGLPSGASVCADKVNTMKYYAVSENSFYSSEDGGVTFRRISSNIEANSKPFTSAEEGSIWLCGKKTYFSSDGGSNFILYDGVSCSSMTLGKSPSDSSLYSIYVFGNIENYGQGIYRSDDGGSTWFMINIPEKQFGQKPSAISADLSDTGRIYIASEGRGIITAKNN